MHNQKYLRMKVTGFKINNAICLVINKCQNVLYYTYKYPLFDNKISNSK